MCICYLFPMEFKCRAYLILSVIENKIKIKTFINNFIQSQFTKKKGNLRVIN